MSARLNEIIKLFLKYYCQSGDVLIDLKACRMLLQPPGHRTVVIYKQTYRRRRRNALKMIGCRDAGLLLGSWVPYNGLESRAE